MNVWKDFDTYQFSYTSDSGFAGNVNACEINCYKNNVQVVRICFIKAGVTMPANAINGSVIYVYYPLSQFGDIIGIFRYEKALIVSIDTDTHVASISGEVDKPGKKA
jgi:hypothetical protein